MGPESGVQKRAGKDENKCHQASTHSHAILKSEARSEEIIEEDRVHDTAK